MKVRHFKIGGSIIRDTDVYTVEDNTFLKNLTLSQTVLHPGKETSGHSHPGLEEIYFFISGYGKMQVDEQEFYVGPDDIVLIPDGAFHKVFNTTGENHDLIFNCVFQKYDR